MAVSKKFVAERGEKSPFPRQKKGWENELLGQRKRLSFARQKDEVTVWGGVTEVRRAESE